MHQEESNKTVYIAITTVSSLILAFLFWWIYAKPTASASGDWVLVLPYLNCAFNASTAFLLCLGYRAVKRGEIASHKKLMISAVCTSALFLVSYLIYHHFHGDSKFMGVGVIRNVYLFILASHILLSMIQLPMILGTLWFAYKQNWEQHRKAARVTFPIWLYVSVTGVLVFFFLKIFN